jgi:hypothetical protein
MNNVDSIRLEQFRQIRNEIRGSTEYLIVGIDVAKDKNYVFYGTATGKTLLKRMIKLLGYWRLASNDIQSYLKTRS